MANAPGIGMGELLADALTIEAASSVSDSGLVGQHVYSPSRAVRHLIARMKPQRCKLRQEIILALAVDCDFRAGRCRTKGPFSKRPVRCIDFWIGRAARLLQSAVMSVMR